MEERIIRMRREKGGGVRVQVRKDGGVKSSSVKSVRRLLEHAPVTYTTKHPSNGFAIYLVAEGDEGVERAIMEAIDKGSSRLRVRVKMLRVSW
ncbi:hypothetical protein HRbin02_01023 [Candidatus Calditenuaceae archaeon HR02]|nr:hypothetical protein HRbin02_01023 [Candidatus Calditenuaceae archaeon HR02]